MDVVDRETGTWFNVRDLTITTQGNPIGSATLFLPAKPIDLESVVEDEVTLVSGAEEDYLSFGFWLEIFGSHWSTEPQSVVLTGTFGLEECPEEIREATAQIAAILGGWMNRTYVDGEGVAEASVLGAIPKVIKETINGHKRMTFDSQPFLIVEN